MSLTTSPFYDSPPIQSLGVILATLLGIIAVIWVARNVRLPKRRLYYGIIENIPLLTPNTSVANNLQLLHKGIPLGNPHLVTVGIVVRGRQGIGSDDFDSNEPLHIDIGAPIISILDTTSKPDTFPAPSVTADGSVLAIGPSLIHCGQRIKTSVLIDENNPTVSCQSPLKNVKIRRQRPDDPELHVLLLGPHNLFVIGALGGVGAIFIAQISKSPLDWIPFMISLPLMTLALIGGVWSFWVMLRKPVNAKRAATTISAISRRK